MFNLKYVFVILCVFFIKETNAQKDVVATSVKYMSTHELFVTANEHLDSNYNGVDTAYCLNGNEIIKVFIEYKSGIKIRVEGYYDNSQIFRVSSFKENLCHGIETQWYKNGQKEFQVGYENGIEITPFITWYETGELESYSDYNQKKNTGIVKEWHKNGHLKSEIISVDSTELGCEERYYYDNGSLSTVQFNNMNKQKYLGYYKSGKLKFEGNIFNAIWNSIGKWQEWYENGVLKREYFFEENQPNIKTGTWSWWDEDGNLIKQEIYKNNELLEEKKFVPINKKTD
ncbi:MAG: toxin-antitoxin system YwqK family antitoxin [Salinivirgaceae bacterium]